MRSAHSNTSHLKAGKVKGKHMHEVSKLVSSSGRKEIDQNTVELSLGRRAMGEALNVFCWVTANDGAAVNSLRIRHRARFQSPAEAANRFSAK